LKAIEHISRNVKNTNLEKIFSHRDIDKILFLGKYPLYKAYPFKSFKKLSNIPVVYKVLMYDLQDDMDEILSKSVYSIGNIVTTNPELQKLDIILLDALLSEFSTGAIQWQKYVLQEMENYIKTPTSLINWEALKTVSGFLGTNLNYEQKIWIFTCQREEDKKKVKFAEDLRESVLPFLNFDMWQKLQRRKEAVRENVMYHKQRDQMIEGTFLKQEEELDIIT